MVVVDYESEAPKATFEFEKKVNLYIAFQTKFVICKNVNNAVFSETETIAITRLIILNW